VGLNLKNNVVILNAIPRNPTIILKTKYGILPDMKASIISNTNAPAACPKLSIEYGYELFSNSKPSISEV
jgi:hypothetical protein